MKVKLTKEKVIQMHNALTEIGEEKPNAKFAYAVAKNINVIEPEVRALLKAQEQSKEYREFDSKRASICREMARQINELLRIEGQHLSCNKCGDYMVRISNIEKENICSMCRSYPYE